MRAQLRFRIALGKEPLAGSFPRVRANSRGPSPRIGESGPYSSGWWGLESLS